MSERRHITVAGALDGLNYEGVEEYIRTLHDRMEMNLQQTGHPFHHLTRSGEIVNRDGQVDADILEHLWLCDTPIGYVPQPWKRPKKAVTPIPDWYSTRAGKQWLKKHPVPQQQPVVPQQGVLIWEVSHD